MPSRGTPGFALPRWATFSSSVMRETRSAARSSNERSRLRNAGSADHASEALSSASPARHVRCHGPLNRDLFSDILCLRLLLVSNVRPQDGAHETTCNLSAQRRTVYLRSEDAPGTLTRAKRERVLAPLAGCLELYDIDCFDGLGRHEPCARTLLLLEEKLQVLVLAPYAKKE